MWLWYVRRMTASVVATGTDAVNAAADPAADSAGRLAGWIKVRGAANILLELKPQNIIACG